MQKKLINTFFTAMVMVVMFFSYSHASTSVTLDGIANAGYWADDLKSTYLYVKDLADDSYYFQWRYGVNPDPLPWSNLDELVADLNTKNFNWWLESGGDPFTSPANPIWTSIFLEKGLYDIRLAPDSSAYNLAAYWGTDSWNNYVQIWADYDDSFNFGEGSYIANSASDSLNFYRTNVDGMTISLKENTNLHFFINDWNSVDNEGSVKLNVSVVPEPGQVLLFISGALPLAASYNRKRVWSMLKRYTRTE